jgi:GT2 family glycosyltransferase
MTVSAPVAACDLVVSFVLYRTPPDEVAAAVAQVLGSAPRARVVLVDNGPEEKSWPGADDPRVEVIRPGANIGYGAGHNRAIAATAGVAPFHVVLNTDLAFGPDTLPGLLDFMRARPDVVLAMPRITYPDGRLQHLARLLPTPFDLFARGFLGRTAYARRRNDRYENRDWGYDATADFPFLSGCFMFIRRAALDAVGGFDERFFLYGEDADLSRRLHLTGRTAFVPLVSATHEYRSLAQASLQQTVVKIVNLARYFNKWGWFIDPDRALINAATRRALGLR